TKPSLCQKVTIHHVYKFTVMMRLDSLLVVLTYFINVCRKHKQIQKVRKNDWTLSSLTCLMELLQQIEKVVFVSLTIWRDQKSIRLNSSHVSILYAVFFFKK